jgi:hypothetical protein
MSLYINSVKEDNVMGIKSSSNKQIDPSSILFDEIYDASKLCGKYFYEYVLIKYNTLKEKKCTRYETLKKSNKVLLNSYINDLDLFSDLKEDQSLIMNLISSLSFPFKKYKNDSDSDHDSDNDSDNDSDSDNDNDNNSDNDSENDSESDSESGSDEGEVEIYQDLKGLEEIEDKKNVSIIKSNLLNNTSLSFSSDPLPSSSSFSSSNKNLEDLLQQNHFNGKNRLYRQLKCLQSMNLKQHLREKSSESKDEKLNVDNEKPTNEDTLSFSIRSHDDKKFEDQDEENNNINEHDHIYNDMKKFNAEKEVEAETSHDKGSSHTISDIFSNIRDSSSYLDDIFIDSEEDESDDDVFEKISRKQKEIDEQQKQQQKHDKINTNTNTNTDTDTITNTDTNTNTNTDTNTNTINDTITNTDTNTDTKIKNKSKIKTKDKKKKQKKKQKKKTNQNQN